jgi:hypothetical protein
MLTVGYNPRPELPDPFALAVALGYSRPEQEGWDIGSAMDRAIATNATHAEALRAAHVQRYGVGWDQPGGLGAEHATSVWPKVLSTLYGGFPSYREVHDATFFGTKSMVVEAWQKSGVPGYSPDKPQKVVPGDPVWGFGLTGFPDPEPRLYMVPPVAEVGEPGWFKNYRDSVWEGTMYYLVERRPGAVSPTPTTTPTTKPTTDPRDGEIADLRTKLNASIADAGTLRKEVALLKAWQTRTQNSVRAFGRKLPNRGGGQYVLAAKELAREILGE